MKGLVPAALAAMLCAAVTTASAQADREAHQEIPVPPARTQPQSPLELRLQRGGSSNIDLRHLPQTAPRQRERPEYSSAPHPVELPGPRTIEPASQAPLPAAPAPAPTLTFDGLDRVGFGQGNLPNANGDAGPLYYIQAINSSVGVFRKSDGVRVAAFSFDTLMAQGSFGNPCDTSNMGSPVVLYDTFEDRWVLSDSAFSVDGGGNVNNPPGAFQCFAVSKTGDPVSGGWNFYSINTAGGLGDYPKLSIWTDSIYMSANMVSYAGAAFQNPRVYALNKTQMYAGAPTAQVVAFDAPSGDFALLPSNARLQTGTPPAGTPAYFVSTWLYTNAVGVYKFHVDWVRIANSTFTGPDVPLAATSWPNAAVANAPALGGSALDVMQIRAMMQNQYSNLGGVESLWTTHTVRRANTTGFAAPRWYQVNVTGGNVVANLPQAATWDPDGANVLHRFMPSLAVDRAGNLALGYSTSSATTKPAIMYAGRLASDPINTFSQTEQVLIQGTGAQTGHSRWGGYSAMTLDPDGCTFWYTNEYYAVDGADYLTRIGAFAYPGCTMAGAGGTVSGTITAQAGGAPLSGAAVMLGSRSTTTDASGHYTFTAIPAGTYQVISASHPGYASGTATNIVVADSATTTQDFALAAAPAAACFTDTTQSDFQTGIATGVDLDTSPGDVALSNEPDSDQVNVAGTTTGTGFGTPGWTGQTFTAGVTGVLVKADVQLFCNGCGATPPNLTLSLRNTSAGLPSGADLATTTIPGALFASGASIVHTATFAVPAALTAGTQYALVLRPVSAPAGTGYFWIRSSPSTYANGSRVLSADSGGTWTADTTRDYNFRTYIQTGYIASGELISAVKDANPAAGRTPIWQTLSWNASTPANTTLRFQIAASNSANGPFNFVGPDGTAATFFTTSSASLNQFYDKRYLKYRAYLDSMDGAVTPVLNDATVCFANQTPPDLSLSKSDGGASVAPGGTVAYSLTYTNGGEQSATGVVLTETVPANSTFNAGASTAGWLCMPDNNAGSTCTLAIGSVAGSGSGNATFAVTAVNPVAAGVTQLSNTASVADDGTHGTDPTPADNSASDTTPVNAAPDLNLSKSDGGASVAPGGVVGYSLNYANAGNQGATGVVLTETVPANTTFNPGASSAGWSCAPNNNAGSLCTLAIGSLAGGGTGVASYAVTVDASLSPGVTQISNQASIADDGSNGSDPTPGDNTASDTTPVTGADLSITKTDGVTTATPGGSVTYTITASNAGPNAVTGATVADTFPASLTCTWTCVGAGGGTCTAAGSGNIADTVNLPSGGNVTFTASCTISAAATGSLVNTATVAAPAGVTDPAPGNNSATDTDGLGATADLSITKTDGVTSATPGGSVTYTITASNAGPSNATGATVTDTFPASLTCTWTCAGAGGGTCTAAGSGNIADTVNLPSGGNVTYTASCTISASATGSLVNTATVAAPAGVTDPTPGNNSATDTDGLGAVADLSITKTNAVNTVTAGGNVTYTITASNAGPSTAAGASVTDTLPAWLTCTWTCAGTGGGSCTAAGSGSINDTVNLPGSASVTYTASCAISASATGSLVNTASIAAPAGVTDPAPGNNSATETDNIDASADASITVSDGVPAVVAGGTVSYTLVASNAGPSALAPAFVTDNFPAPLTGCAWSCAAGSGASCGSASGSGNLSDSPTLGVAASVTYTATCTVPAGTAGSTVISNTAAIHTGTVIDPSPANNMATDITTVVALPPDGALLSGTKTVSGSFLPGSSVMYTITLNNAGPGPQADNAGDEFTDMLPAGLTLVSATATSGTAATAGNAVSWNGTLAAGASVTITITATINPAASGVILNQGTISFDSDGNGSNDASAVTDDPVQSGTGNATGFSVVGIPAGPAVPVPALDRLGLLLLMLGFIGLAARRYRLAP